MTANFFLEKLHTGSPLTQDESREAVFAMMEQRWSMEEAAQFLVALHEKGETVDELTGFACAMRERAVKIHLNGLRVLDTCGTGGDRKNTFNISTTAAFVLAGCGIPVAKHGNHAVSSACGSTDLLQLLGIPYRLKPNDVLHALQRCGFAFLFAPDYHPATKSVVAVRKQLGIPTIFNLLGPLTNPASPGAQLIGVYDPVALPIMEHAVRKMDPEKRAVLVHSETGHDEATPASSFRIHSTFEKPKVCTVKQFGFADCCEEDLRSPAPEQNLLNAISILKGEPGPKRDTVLLNSLLAYQAFFPNASIDDATAAVTESIDSGSAWRVVERCRELL